jgi:hypothetical protein
VSFSAKPKRAFYDLFGFERNSFSSLGSRGLFQRRLTNRVVKELHSDPDISRKQMSAGLAMIRAPTEFSSGASP